MEYSILQGKFYIAERKATGKPDGFRYIGNVPQASIALQEQTLEHTESYSGQRFVDKVVGLNKSGTLDVTMDEFTVKNLTLAMRGTATSVTGTSVTAEAFAGVKTGSFIKLANINVDPTTVVVKDDNSPPQTITASGNWAIADADAGIIEILSGGVISDGDDITVDYDFTTADKITTFTQASDKDHYVLFSGKNQADNLKPITIEIFKVRFPPIGSLELITNEFGTLDLQAMIQYDSLNTTDGGFMKVFK